MTTPKSTLSELQKRYPKVRVIAPARSKEALIAAIYLAVDAPDYAGDNYDALADIVHDLSWLPEGPVRLAWVGNSMLPPPVQRQVAGILAEAAKDTARSTRPLTVYPVTV